MKPHERSRKEAQRDNNKHYPHCVPSRSRHELF